MLIATTAALPVTLAGQLNRVLGLGLIGIAFLGLGQVFGTATALAIERVPHAAGTDSAVLGTLQSVLGAIASPLVGLGRVRGPARLVHRRASAYRPTQKLPLPRISPSLL
jgi:DHA1 family bicyclomycin/chloramphenicol resistance-like MFS transporter